MLLNSRNRVSCSPRQSYHDTHTHNSTLEVYLEIINPLPLHMKKAECDSIHAGA